jgi:hypothetical protein
VLLHRRVLGVPAHGARTSPPSGFDVGLVFRLARRPV